tara:strand:+ start:639 stop:1403 length:765 start_codon:yes stop_codon:yes gene_type:complete
MSDKVGAYFQTYKNLKASEFVIKNFREHHPNAPMTVISDAGSNFSEICKKYNCNYQHRFLNLGRQGTQNIKIESEYPVDVRLAFNREETLVWLQRFYESCLYCVENGANYIVMLEDDVYIKGEINKFPEGGFSCGPRNTENLIKPDFMRYLMKKYDVKFNVDYYACCGGAVFNAKIFVDNYIKIFTFINTEFDILQSMDTKTGWLDFFIHIIYFYLGCSYSINSQFSETWWLSKWNIDWKDPKYSIVHQYKNFY